MEDKKNTTPNGKEIQIVMAPNSMMRKIVFTSGGQLPKEFDGLFTSERDAQIVIDRYLEKKSS